MATGSGGLIGTGIVPGGSIGSELSAITRRAFIPKLIVQLYKASPVLNMLMRGAQRAVGGVGQITVTVTSMLAATAIFASDIKSG